MREFGWDIWQYWATPQSVLDEIITGLNAEAEAQKVLERRNKP